jgi:serine/threonine protein kinase/tetratricopeptide (TPR) repeat protein
MGSVYKVRDRELDRVVALKVIRSELTDQPEILQRFKQELILARQVTHKNVIRIFDLGEADGIKFISMDYIEGQNLRSLLKEKGKFTPRETTAIIIQVCQALDAAHTEGVVHRDLKPQNIMIDSQGNARVMDFGIAHSTEFSGMTQTGALLGTPAYMSPEQAKGLKADERSDLFALGIILYELLTGQTPFNADTALATLLKRTLERALPPTELDPMIPRYLSDIVLRCLETDPELRYQKASDVLTDLQTMHRPGTTLWVRLLRFRTSKEYPARWPILALITILLVITVLVFRTGIFQPTVKASVSLAIIPFRNASGDPSLDWVGTYVAETLGTAIGQSSSLQLISQERVRQSLHDLQLSPASNLDRGTARRVVESSGAQSVVWGQYLKFGDQIRIEATLDDSKTERTATLRVEAPTTDALPLAVDRLAHAVREKLSLSSSVVRELQAQAFSPSSKSIIALRDYNEGLELARRRNDLEARKRLETAVQADPQFALAHAKLSEVYSLLGYEKEAQKSSGKAVQLSENLPAPEKYRIAASHLRVLRNYPKAIAAYENLAKATPNDTDVQFSLGYLYRLSGAYDKARSLYGQLLKSDQKSAEALFDIGRVEVMAGNLQTALEYLNRALSITIQGENDEEKALVLHIVGVAYRKLGKPEEAMRNYQESLAIMRHLGEKSAMARSLNEMGQLLYGIGKSDDALIDYQDALKLRREIGDNLGIGETLIDLGNLYNERGDFDRALQTYQESLQIQRDLSSESSQAICLNNMGNVYLSRGNYQQALTFYQLALQLREKLGVPSDIAETTHNLGETSVRMGQFDQALSQFLRALDLYRGTGSQRDIAIEQSSTAFVFKQQGRYGAAVRADEEALKILGELQDRGFWLADILSGYGNSLSLVGRNGDAEQNLLEALAVAQDIKSDPLIAQVRIYQGDLSFYQGDFKSARSLYEQSLQISSHASDREKVFTSKFGLAKVTLKEGRTREAAHNLPFLCEQAESSGMKYLSLECSVYSAEAAIVNKDYARGRKQLENELPNSEKLGSRMQTARIHYLLGTSMRLSGDTVESIQHYSAALQLLADIQREPGAEHLTDRPDLHAIYVDSANWTRRDKPQ